MDMGMEPELLIPSVQHGEEAEFRAEVLRIASDFEKCFCTGAEQQIVDDFLVLQSQWSKLRRKCEDHMDVARGEKFSLPCGDPAFPGPRSDTSGSGDLGSCCRRWWHDARSGCIHRDGRRVRRCDSAQWPAVL